MSAISSIPGGFNGVAKVGYWTPQKEIADRYAQWAKHKCEISEVAIIQVAVSERLMRTLTVGYV